MTSVYEWHCSHARTSALVMGRTLDLPSVIELTLQTLQHSCMVLRVTIATKPRDIFTSQIGLKMKVKSAPKNKNKKRINK
jgi:hypothetical protein